MLARVAGSGLGLLAFAITLVAGLLVGNPPMVILSRGLFALFLFFAIGLTLGGAARLVINEYERKRQEEITRPFREAAGENAAEDPSQVRDPADRSAMTV